MLVDQQLTVAARAEVAVGDPAAAVAHPQVLWLHVLLAHLLL